MILLKADIQISRVNLHFLYLIAILQMTMVMPMSEKLRADKIYDYTVVVSVKQGFNKKCPYNTCSR